MSGVTVIDILHLIAGSPIVLTEFPSPHASTILMDGSQPAFVVRVPALRLIPPYSLGGKLNIKPNGSGEMMGFWPPAIRNFWPMWEAIGDSVRDIAGGNNGLLVDTGYSGDLFWENVSSTGYPLPWPTTLQPAIKRAAVPSSAPVDVTLTTPIVLSGEWSIDFCWRIPWVGGTPPESSKLWTHTVITNSKTVGIQGYTSGVLNPAWATTQANPYPPGNMLGPLVNTTSLVNGVYAETFTLTGLLQAMGYMNFGSMELEYFRIWRRVLNQVEIQSLAADPFCMFGLTAETLAEIKTIIDFMSPTKESWFFVFDS